MSKPSAFVRHPLPLLELPPDSFEDFVLAALDAMHDSTGLRIKGQPAGTSDGGFDILAVRREGGTVCIQVKRYTKALSLPLVGEELAKVALNAGLDGQKIAEHWFITTSTVQQKLERALREDTRAILIDQALRSSRGPTLKALHLRAESAQLDPVRGITDYVRNLDNIEVWSGRLLENKLAANWSYITALIERYFVLQPVLREKPRPDFDLDDYLRRTCTRAPGHRMPLVLRQRAELPAGVGLDGYQGSWRPERRWSTNTKDPLSLVLDANPGVVVLVSGAGGAGKSTLLKDLRAELASDAVQDRRRTIPVLIESPSSGSEIDTELHRALRITIGHWSSLSTPLTLLIDGLSEAPVEFRRHLAAWLRTNASLVAATIVTTRDSIHPGVLALASVDECVELAPPTWQEVRLWSIDELGRFASVKFLAHIDRLVRAGSMGLFETRYGLVLAKEHYAVRASLPPGLLQLFESFVERRLSRDEQSEGSLDPTLRTVPTTTVSRIAEAVAFQFIIVEGTTSLRVDDGGRVLRAALCSNHVRQFLGAEGLSPTQVLALLFHYDLILRLSSGDACFVHDWMAAYLASRVLVNEWMAHLSTMQLGVRGDAWLLAALRSTSDRGTILDHLATVMPASIAGLNDGLFPVTRERVRTLALSDWESESRPRMVRGASVLALSGEKDLALLVAAASNFDKSVRGLIAARVLVTSGHEPTCRDVLARADADSDFDLNYQTSATRLVSSIPPVLLLDLARRNLEQHNEGFRTIMAPAPRASLTAVGSLGDRTDLPALLQIMDETKEYSVLSHTFFAAAQIDRETAQRGLVETARNSEMSEEDPQIVCLLVKARIEVSFETLLRAYSRGRTLDVHRFLERVDRSSLRDAPEPYIVTDWLRALDLAELEAGVDPDAIDPSPDDACARTWFVARHFEILLPEEVIHSRFARSKKYERIAIMRYLVETSRVHGPGESWPTLIDDYIAGLSAYERTERAALIVEALDVVVGRERAQTHLVEALRSLSRRIVEAKHDEAQLGVGPKYEFHFELQRLAEITASFAGSIEPELLSVFLEISDSTGTSVEESLLKIARHIPAELADQTLLAIGDAFTQDYAIQILLQIQRTKVREDALWNAMPEALTHPARIVGALRSLSMINDVDNALRFVQLLSATRIEGHLVHHIESFLAERSHAYHQRRSDFDALISSATHNHDSLALFRDMALDGPTQDAS